MDGSDFCFVVNLRKNSDGAKQLRYLCSNTSDYFSLKSNLVILLLYRDTLFAFKSSLLLWRDKSELEIITNVDISCSSAGVLNLSHLCTPCIPLELFAYSQAEIFLICIHPVQISNNSNGWSMGYVLCTRPSIQIPWHSANLN